MWINVNCEAIWNKILLIVYGLTKAVLSKVSKN